MHSKENYQQNKKQSALVMGGRKYVQIIYLTRG